MSSSMPRQDPLLGLKPTASQKATMKYFFVVAALWVVQVALGAIVAHYGVEGGGFYGIPLAKWLPYSVARTWHLQIGIFWIATSWLATGLYIAPAVSGLEPKGQRLGVNVLFAALIAGGRWFTRGRVDGHPAETRQSMVLVRLAGLRICRSRPPLADPALCRFDVLAVADVARSQAGVGAQRRKPLPAYALPCLEHCDPGCSTQPVSCTGSAARSLLPNTGAGGSSISGSKGSLKSSPRS